LPVTAAPDGRRAERLRGTAGTLPRTTGSARARRWRRMARRAAGPCASRHRQRQQAREAYQLGAMLPQLREGCSRRRTHIDRVVCQQHSLAAHDRAQRLHDPVAHRTALRLQPLGIGKANAELCGNELRDECAAGQRAADDVGPTAGGAARRLPRPVAHAPRIDQQSVEIEPEIAMMPRLVAEMPACRRHAARTDSSTAPSLIRQPS
jgi:hypothetical protein